MALFILSPLSHLFFVPSRRVHISSVTLEHLNGSYKVEPGDGQSRDSYLKEHGVVTFLVVNPKVRYRSNRRRYTSPKRYLPLPGWWRVSPGAGRVPGSRGLFT